MKKRSVVLIGVVLLLAVVLLGCGLGSKGPDTLQLASNASIQTTSGGVPPTRTLVPAFTPTRAVVFATTVPGVANQGLAAPMVQATVTSSEPCKDGELLYTHNKGDADLNSRTPLADGLRFTIIEIARPGKGFGGLDRAIVVAPMVGTVWSLNSVPHAATLSGRAFCGSAEEVTAWAIKAHVPSLQQASRAPDGKQPPADEIGVYVLNYEGFPGQAASFSVAKTAPSGPSPEVVAGWFDLSFNDGQVNGPTQIRVVNGGAAVSLAAPAPAVQATLTPLVLVAPVQPKVVKCDPIQSIQGSSATNIVATSPEVIDLFAGATGKLVTYLLPGQSFEFDNLTAPYNYTRWLMPVGCDVRALASQDAIAPDGRKFVEPSALPGVAYDPPASSALAPVKAEVAGLKVVAPASVVTRRYVNPGVAAAGISINPPPSGNTHWVVDVVDFSYNQDVDERVQASRDLGVPVLRGQNAIYVEVVDANGVRKPDTKVQVWWGSDKGTIRNTDEKVAPDFLDFIVSGNGGVFNVVVADGQPSEWVSGLGMGNHQKVNGAAVRKNTHFGGFVRFREVQ